MTIDEMNSKRIEYGLTYKDISEGTSLPISTVQKIFGGLTKAPRRETVMRLQKYLEGYSHGEVWGQGNRGPSDHPASSGDGAYAMHSSPPILKESSSYKSGTVARKQGEYTLEDYYALPEDVRAELIDGVIYNMDAPAPVHQLIGGDIYYQLVDHKKRKKEKCQPFISPIDVQLDCDNKTMVQPDVIILCDISKITKRCVYGAPDFIVEVLSPSTRKKDMSVKMMKYINAGVREYWMIDTEKRVVMVYDLEHLEIPKLYGFHDPIPVGVWDGECVIDLSDVAETLDMWNL